MSKPPYYVSFHDFASLGYNIEIKNHFKTEVSPDGEERQVCTDIQLTEIATPKGESLCKDAVGEALYILGMDTKASPWEVGEARYHRPLSCNEAVLDNTFEGVERTDDEWLSSGNASEAALLYSCDSKDMRDAVRSLARGNSDGW